MIRPLGITRRGTRSEHLSPDPTVTAALVTILVASLAAALVGGVADHSVKGLPFIEATLRREMANLIAAVPAALLIVLLAKTRAHRPTGLAYLVWSSILVVLLLGAVRFAMQSLLGIADFNERAEFALPELARLPMLWVMLIFIRWVVTQRERWINAERVLTSEAQRALDDDHEALRSRVFDHLHGTVTSELVVARVRLNDIAEDVPDPATRQKVLDVSAHIRRIHELEVRQLAHVMVASGLDTSLEEAVREMASSCEGLCDVTIHIDPNYAAVDRDLAPDARARLRLSAYRIVEECLSNALQHGAADHVDISVQCEVKGRATFVRLEVASNGTIPATPHVPGAGLRVIRARAASHHGSVTTAIRDGHFIVSADLAIST